MNLEFTRSQPLTLGVELELQLVDRRDYDLVGAAGDVLAIAKKKAAGWEIKPEITESMIEISTSIHANGSSLWQELEVMREVMVKSAMRINVGLCGGGAHPFQQWSDLRVYPTQRFHKVHELYGYLAKQFTVFGQHVHLGCESGDEAIALCHQLARYIPHFIALSASSPYYQGVDTRFESSRLNVVSAFPLSGHLPDLQGWEAFNAHFERLRSLGVVESMKDFYWDIRPKPEFGTVEIRIFDTPLTLRRAADLAIYAQALARHLTANAPPISEDTYLVYRYNRFLASRFGFDAQIIDAQKRTPVPLADDIRHTITPLLAPSDADTKDALMRLQEAALLKRSDAAWIRDRMQRGRSLQEVVRQQTELWALN